MTDPYRMLEGLGKTLEEELPTNFLYEHDAQDQPAFELETAPLILHQVQKLRNLDARRLQDNPETKYLFAPHAFEVAQDLEALACHLGTPEHVATTLYYLGLVHDIGKLLLPPSIWGTSREKPANLFLGLRRTHGPLGAALLSGDLGYLGEPYIPSDVLGFLKGEKSLADLAPPDLKKTLPDRIDFEGIQKTILSSPFKGHTTSFLPLAIAATLRHHEPTGAQAPKDQPLWLKFLALLEDLSGNMVARPHYAGQNRQTSLGGALEHMRQEKEGTAHDRALLDLIGTVKEMPIPDSWPSKHFPNPE